jgi:hypothetical protein
MNRSLSIGIGGVFLTGALLVSACTPKHYLQVHENTIALYSSFPDAEEVLFASSIDRYRLHRAHRVSDDVWEVVVPREHSFFYFYLVDEQPALPDCKFTVDDDFGARNCLYEKGL